MKLIRSFEFYLRQITLMLGLNQSKLHGIKFLLVTKPSAEQCLNCQKLWNNLLKLKKKMKSGIDI